jgi:transposase
MSTTKRYPPEFRQRAIRLVETAQQGGKSEWAAIQSVGEKLGCTHETLRRWIRQDQRDQGKRAGLTTDDQARLKALEKENKELRRANEILKTASAFFAQAEGDRQSHCAN